MSVRLDGAPIAKNGDKADPLLNVSFRAVPVVASLDGDVCGRKPCCQVHAPYTPVAGGIACKVSRQDLETSQKVGIRVHLGCGGFAHLPRNGEQALPLESECVQHF